MAPAPPSLNFSLYRAPGTSYKEAATNSPPKEEAKNWAKLMPELVKTINDRWAIRTKGEKPLPTSYVELLESTLGMRCIVLTERQKVYLLISAAMGVSAFEDWSRTAVDLRYRSYEDVVASFLSMLASTDPQR